VTEPGHGPAVPTRLTVLAGPTAVGKGSVSADIRTRHPEVWISISATTRRPRPGEQDGVHNWFVYDAEIDLQGARQVHAAMPDALMVFLAPPSWEELVRRLVGRGTENDEERERRLATARQELAAETEFDVTIVNTEIHDAAEELVALMVGPAGPS
jgi:guanylate kinase